jgi:hypothetical protein
LVLIAQISHTTQNAAHKYAQILIPSIARLPSTLR